MQSYLRRTKKKMKHTICNEQGIGYYSYFKHKFIYILGDEQARLKAYADCLRASQNYPNMRSRERVRKTDIST